MSKFSLLPTVGAMTIACLLVILEGCVHEPINPTIGVTPDPGPTPSPIETCDPNTIYFENEILPILISNCAKSSCHDAATAEDGINLTSYTAMMNSGVIDAFDANDSELFEKITESDADDVMPPPPNSRLTLEQISKIRIWINQGAKKKYVPIAYL